MDKIAFILGETFLYWNAIIVAFAALIAAILFLAFYLGRSGNGFGAFLAIPMAFFLSLMCSRFVHWYCQADSYASMESAMQDFTSGGYALCGAFAGCLVTALLLRATTIVKDLPQMLDAMALAGTAGIGVGRLACFYSSADRGNILDSAWELPYAWPVTNPVTGVQENRMAIFLLQAICCGVIFLILLTFWLLTRRRTKSGNTFLIFSMLYGTSQVIFDSMRYDSLYFRSNGFISIVQILGAAGILLGIVIYSVRMVRRRGLQWWQFLLWLTIASLLGTAGYMEYYVQRHGNEALLAYSVMTLCLSVLLGVVLLFIAPIGRPKKEKVLL